MKKIARSKEISRRGRDALVARLSSELKSADDDPAVGQFLDAESTVERYLEAVE